MTSSCSTGLVDPLHRTDIPSEQTGWAGSRAKSVMLLLAAVLPLGGCISVNAPDKPIVIELNINIKQEVVYRLAEDVKQNIEANPDIF